MKPVLQLASVLLIFVLSANAQTQAPTTKKTDPKKTTTTTTSVSISNKATNALNGTNNAVNNANNAINNANNKYNNAASNLNNSYNKASNTVNKILNYGKTDSSKTAPVTGVIPPSNTPPGKPSDTLVQNLKKLTSLFKKPKIDVLIKLPGANRARLKEFCELLKTCKNVDAKSVDFDDAQQTITVPGYKGKLNDLLSEMQKKNPVVTGSNTNASAADNSITINLQ